MIGGRKNSNTRKYINMASREQVKTYLACWFQLRKKLISHDGTEISFANSTINGDRYSPEFEACWQEIITRKGKNYHLEGTESTIEDLLSSKWNIVACARCNMPTPQLELGVQSTTCPCGDLPLWPNLELPLPHPPIDSNSHIAKIQSRLSSKSTVK